MGNLISSSREYSEAKCECGPRRISTKKERQKLDYISNEEYRLLYVAFEQLYCNGNMSQMQKRLFPLAVGNLLTDTITEFRLKQIRNPEIREYFSTQFKEVAEAEKQGKLKEATAEKQGILTHFHEVTSLNDETAALVCKSRVTKEEFNQLFQEQCANLANVDYFVDYLGGSKMILKAEKDTLELQCENETTIKDYLERRKEEIEGYSKLSVRIIVTALSDEPVSGLEVWTASKITPFGLNHVGLQIGPYYIHWHKGNLVTIHPIASEKSRAVSAIYPLYPAENSFVSKDDLIKLADVIVRYNTGSAYARVSHDCHCFVKDALDALGLAPKWINNGPIAQLMGTIKECKSNQHAVLVKDPAGVPYKIASLAELTTFAKNTEHLLKNLPAGVKNEYLEAHKCIQRAFQFHGKTIEVNEASNNRLIKLLSDELGVNCLTSDDSFLSAEGTFFATFKGSKFTEGQK